MSIHTLDYAAVPKSKEEKQRRADLASERRIRDLIVAAHTLSLITKSKHYLPTRVAVEDLQALLRLLDRARLATKVRHL